MQDLQPLLILHTSINKLGASILAYQTVADFAVDGLMEQLDNAHDQAVVRSMA